MLGVESRRQDRTRSAPSTCAFFVAQKGARGDKGEGKEEGRAREKGRRGLKWGQRTPARDIPVRLGRVWGSKVRRERWSRNVGPALS